jgi:hypothetical protein
MLNIEPSSVRRIITAAGLAPSAENNQPWLFRVAQDSIEVYLDTARSLASDVEHMFDLTALGAAIENGVLAASAEQIKLAVRLGEIKNNRPADGGLIHVASLAARGDTAPDPLAAHIASRVTCRTLLRRPPLSRAWLIQMSDAAAEFEAVHVDWVTDSHRIRALSHLVGLGDRIRFEFPPFQQEFFGNLRFTPGEASATGDGLDVRTLELPPGGAIALGLLRHLWVLRAGNRAGLSRLLVGPSKRWVRRAPAVGFLTTQDASGASFVRGGRGLERVWLTATSLGLGLHPLGSLPIFMAYAERTDGARLTARHRASAGKIAADVRRIVPDLQDRVVQLAFRVGVPRPPECRSLRLPLDRVLRS